jgi:hypothetical protein
MCLGPELPAGYCLVCRKKPGELLQDGLGRKSKSARLCAGCLADLRPLEGTIATAMVLGYDGLNVFIHGPQPEDPTNTAGGNYKRYLESFLRDVTK